MQLKLRDGEVRFSSASNAFSSCAEIVGSNGCRPSFSEFPHPSMLPNQGATSLDKPTICGNEGCET
jgi:hypothetical protein